MIALKEILKLMTNQLKIKLSEEEIIEMLSP